MSMFEQAKYVWQDGAMVPWSEATVHVSSHALHYGTGVFEGIRCYGTEEGPAIFRLDAHVDRWLASAEVYGIRMRFSRQELTQAICETVRQNGFESCYVRPICYYGSHSLGLIPDHCPVGVSILAWPWKNLHGGDPLTKGVHITVSRWTKFHSSMMPTTAKACGQYLNSIIALREAAGAGFDEALLLDRDGMLAEGSGENLFFVRNNVIYTNDERSSILLGITRDSVITLARDLGFRVEVGSMTVDALLAADEAFFTGTAAEVAPIRAIDHKPIGTGTRGKITEALQKAFFAAVTGHDRKYRHWLQFAGAPGTLRQKGAAAQPGSEPSSLPS
jgi:branched-chain amino acid aminotransferase